MNVQPSRVIDLDSDTDPEHTPALPFPSGASPDNRPGPASRKRPLVEVPVVPETRQPPSADVRVRRRLRARAVIEGECELEPVRVRRPRRVAAGPRLPAPKRARAPPPPRPATLRPVLAGVNEQDKVFVGGEFNIGYWIADGGYSRRTLRVRLIDDAYFYCLRGQPGDTDPHRQLHRHMVGDVEVLQGTPRQEVRTRSMR